MFQSVSFLFFLSGVGGGRSHNLQLAKLLLSQLSYDPIAPRARIELAEPDRQSSRFPLPQRGMRYPHPHLHRFFQAFLPFFFEPVKGLEPSTFRLQIRCSTNLSYTGKSPAGRLMALRRECPPVLFGQFTPERRSYTQISPHFATIKDHMAALAVSVVFVLVERIMA